MNMQKFGIGLFLTLLIACILGYIVGEIWPSSVPFSGFIIGLVVGYVGTTIVLPWAER